MPSWSAFACARFARLMLYTTVQRRWALSQGLRAASAPFMSLQQHPTTCAKNAPKHAVASRANYARPKDDTLTSHLREAFKLLEGRLANCDHDSPEPITFSALERELPVAGFSDALFANTFSPPPASSTLVFSSHVFGQRDQYSAFFRNPINHRAVKHTGRFHPDINSAPMA